MSCSKNAKKYIHVAITLLLMIGIGLLPSFGQVTPLGMKVLGVFLGMMYGWIFVELTWPSILGIFFLALTGYSTITELFGSLFNSTVMQALLCFLAATLFNNLKATDYVATKIMSSKFLIGKTWTIVAVIFFTTALISLLSTSMPAIFLMWAITMNITKHAGYAYNDKSVAFLIAGVVYAGAFGDMLLPFKATTISYIGFASSVMEINIPILNYALLMLIFFVFMMILYMLFGKYILHLDMSKLSKTSTLFLKEKQQKASRIQKIGLILMIVFMAILLLPTVLPKTWIICKCLNQIGLIGACVIVIVAGAIIKNDEGNSIVSIESLFGGVGWSLIWLLASTFPMAEALRSPDIGIMATVNEFIIPLIDGMSVISLIVMTVIVLGLLTQLTHNGVLAIIFYPVVLPLIEGMGGNPMVAWFAIFIILQCAFATPAASMYSGFVFGNKSLSTGKYAYVLGISIFVFGLVLVLALLPIMNILL